MNAIIREIYESGETVAPDGGRHALGTISVRESQGEAIYGLVRKLRPKETMEVGMAWGLSTLFILQGLEDNGEGKHTAMDPYQRACYHHAGLHAVERAGLGGRFSFLEESSHTALARFVSEKRRADFIFIDGSHLFDAAFVDFFFADQLLPVGGVLVFDDLWMPAVRKVLMFALSNLHYEVAEDLLPAEGNWVGSRVQDLKYRMRKRRQGRRRQGTLPESAFHRYRNVNWTVLRKAGADDRAWDHYVGF